MIHWGLVLSERIGLFAQSILPHQFLLVSPVLYQNRLSFRVDVFTDIFMIHLHGYTIDFFSYRNLRAKIARYSFGRFETPSEGIPHHESIYFMPIGAIVSVQGHIKTPGLGTKPRY